MTWQRNFIRDGDYDIHIAVAGRSDPFTAADWPTAIRISTIICPRCWWAARAGPGRLAASLKVAPQTPITNLYVTMLANMGVAVEQMGDSTGALSGLSGLS